MITAVILLRAAYTDLKWGKVKNTLILCGLLSGVILRIIFGFPDGVTDWILAVILPVAVGWILFRIRAVGAGDIKLFCVIGAINGCEILGRTFVVSLILAGAYGLYELGRRRQIAAAFSDFFFYLRDFIAGNAPDRYPGSDRPERKIHICAAVCCGYLFVRLF